MTENRIIWAFALFFLVGIILHLVPSLGFIPERITDLFLFSANIIVLFRILKINRLNNKQSAFLALFFSAWIFTYAAEAIGVYTGSIFGDYHYGATMKLQVLEVPLIIPFNWVMLVLGMTSIFHSLRIRAWMVPFLSALGLVVFDYTMEPVAVILDYWTWKGGVIPLQNYLAWFLIAGVVSSATLWSGINLDRKLLRYYVLIQWLFFLILNVFFRLL
jgi:uncharacterized membrane protein